MRAVAPVGATVADRAIRPPRERITHRSNPMLDILMLALAFGLFALAIGYTYACERL